MKIVSINSELTKSPNEVAFNIDKQPTEFEIKEITAPRFYGSLTVVPKQGYLLITTGKDEKPLNAETIDNFNTKLSSVQQQEEQMKRKHDDMVKHVAELTGLPID